MARADLKEALGHVFDIERLTTRILYGSATPREVKALGDTCAMLPQVKAQAAKRKNGNKAHNGQNADHSQQLDHCEAGACRFASHCFVVMTGKTGHALLL